MSDGKVSINDKPSYFHYYNPLNGSIISVERTNEVNTISLGLSKAQKMIKEGGK
jgi:hypothetical protein